MLDFFKSNSLSIDTWQTLFFLHPSADRSRPGTDALIHGSLILDLKKPARVDSLNVTLLGLFDVAYQDASRLNAPVHQSSGRSLERTLALAPGTDQLPAGQTTFAFTMAIPSSTATQQRCTYGRIRHKLVAEAVVNGTKIQAERMIQATAQPMPGACVPALMMLETQDFVEELGAVSATFSSTYLTVGAPLLTEISFACVPQDVDIIRVTLSVLQAFELTFGESTIKPPIQPWRCFLVDPHHPPSLKMPNSTPFTTLNQKPFCSKPDALESLKAGQAYRFEHLARVPSDDHVRPTTLPGAESPIRVAHKLQLDLAFRRPGEPIKNLIITRAVSIASCCCLLATISLPQYSEKPVPLKSPLHECICGSTMQDLTDENGNNIHATSGRATVPVPRSYKIERS